MKKLFLHLLFPLTLTARLTAGVKPAELHLYHDGGHGFGTSQPNPPTASWGHSREQLLWLASRGLWQRQ